MLRIDRHPMSRHPVTPMTESDLRLHLERQGLRDVRLVPYPSYELAPDALVQIVEHAAEGASAVLFDVSRPADLARIGSIIWREASRARLVAAGPSGVTQALCAHWHESGEVRPVPNVPPIVAADGPVLVIAGSLSPVTRRQIESATGFVRLPIDAMLLTPGDDEYLAKLVQQVSDLMRSGHSVIAHTSPLDENLRDETLPGIEVAQATGKFMTRLLSATRPRRIGVAGGDTSSWALRALDVWGLSFVGHLAPGVALCRVHSGNKNLDGTEIMLKGGQMGPRDLFMRLRGGT